MSPKNLAALREYFKERLAQLAKREDAIRKERLAIKQAFEEAQR
jgi:hypothetical protein